MCHQENKLLLFVPTKKKFVKNQCFHSKKAMHRHTVKSSFKYCHIQFLLKPFKKDLAEKEIRPPSQS